MHRKSIRASYWRDDSGSVAIIFAICFVCLGAFVGAAVDLSRILLIRTQLANAADAAALAAVRQASNDLMAGSSNWQAAGLSAGAGLFTANTANLSSQPPSPTISLTSSATTMSGTVQYSVDVPTTFLGLVGLQTVTVSGAPTVTVTVMPYTDLHIVIDNSPSMGIGAAASDQATLQAANGCEFACHINDGPNRDNLAAARASGATLRIDVAKSAIVDELTALQNQATINGQLRVAVYEFSNSLKNVFALSTDLSGAINAVKAIDLTNEQSQGGTNTTYSLGQLSNMLAQTGSGVSVNSRLGLVFLLTDGLQNSLSLANPTGSLQSYLHDPNYVDLGAQHTNPGVPAEVIQAFDPAACGSIKAKGYTMLTLNVQYVVTNDQTMDFPAQEAFITGSVMPSMTANFQTCASTPGMSITANDPADITSATATLIGLGIARQLRLTN